VASSGDRNFSRCPVCGAEFENRNETLAECPKHRAPVKTKRARHYCLVCQDKAGLYTITANGPLPPGQGYYYTNDDLVRFFGAGKTDQRSKVVALFRSRKLADEAYPGLNCYKPQNKARPFKS
jgi:hypothetical protein